MRIHGVRRSDEGEWFLGGRQRGRPHFFFVRSQLADWCNGRTHKTKKKKKQQNAAQHTRAAPQEDSL
jgi:hypothetical protein